MHLPQFAICLMLLAQPAPALVVNEAANGATAGSEAVTGLPGYSRGYDPERNPFDDGRDALALAKNTGRLVLIEVGGDWCRWCHVLDSFIRSSSRVYAKLHDNFVLLKVNTSEANDNAEFLAGLPRTSGYPHLFISRDDGTLIGSTDTTRLVVNGRYDEQRFLAFLQHWFALKTAGGTPSNR